MKSLKDFQVQIDEVLTKKTPLSKWVHDFVHSDNPKFAGKSKDERIKMAQGAYYGAQKESVEEGENKQMKGKDPCWKGYQMVGMKKKGDRKTCTLAIFEGDCLDENTNVLCMDEVNGIVHKPIKNININDYVITHNNKIAKVLNKSTKVLKLVNIKTRYGNIKASLNHRFMIYDTYLDNYIWLPVNELIKDVKRYKFIYNKLHSITVSAEILNIKYDDEIKIELIDQIITSAKEHKFLVYDLLTQDFILCKAIDLDKNVHLIVFSSLQK